MQSDNMFCEYGIVKFNSKFQEALEDINGIEYKGVQQNTTPINQFIVHENLNVVSLPRWVNYESEDPKELIPTPTISITEHGVRIIVEPMSTKLSFYSYTKGIDIGEITIGSNIIKIPVKQTRNKE